ncbi:MAG TPA: ABC transporter ATP-binding protein [Anaerolineae bacterium]|nr:ABC transporter ATP-binding protein [Anaerolineae bacterium]HOR01283.1 ABC transporter ATP-binding protein [Anaerolineae bacterium]
MSLRTSIIQIENLTRVYGNGAAVRALDGVSLTIGRGEFVAITGPSGSGKSTLLNLIGTLDTPTNGRITVDSVDTRTLCGDRLADFRRQRIGFVFQLFNLIPVLTALENVMLPLIPYQRGLGFKLQEKAEALLETVGLAGRAQHLPGQLSGGEQQRVAIARALVNNPGLILADEPTGNLDSRAGAEIVDLLRRLNREQGVSVVLVTHSEALAGVADRVLRLRDGRLLA